MTGAQQAGTVGRRGIHNDRPAGRLFQCGAQGLFHLPKSAVVKSGLDSNFLFG